MEDTSFSALPDLGMVVFVAHDIDCLTNRCCSTFAAGMLVNSSSTTSKHFNMVRSILLSILIFISTLKIELIS